MWFPLNGTEKYFHPTFNQDFVAINLRQGRVKIHRLLNLVIDLCSCATMCQTIFCKSTTCRHKWVKVLEPCQPGAGFSTLMAMHELKPMKLGFLRSSGIISLPFCCPNCDLRGNYDGNQIRMILSKNTDHGTLGNGYTLTDGYGGALSVGNWYHDHYQQQPQAQAQSMSNATPLNGARMPSSQPLQGPVCCIVM